MNCITTIPLRKKTPLPEFLNLPFNTSTGLKAERTNAGYNPERSVPPAISKTANPQNSFCWSSV